MSTHCKYQLRAISLLHLLTCIFFFFVYFFKAACFPSLNIMPFYTKKQKTKSERLAAQQEGNERFTQHLFFIYDHWNLFLYRFNYFNLHYSNQNGWRGPCLLISSLGLNSENSVQVEIWMQDTDRAFLTGNLVVHQKQTTWNLDAFKINLLNAFFIFLFFFEDAKMSKFHVWGSSC